jgi:hypothetical protein
MMAYIINQDTCKSHSRQEFEGLAAELTTNNNDNPHFLKVKGFVDEGDHENQKILLFEHQTLNSL